MNNYRKPLYVEFSTTKNSLPGVFEGINNEEEVFSKMSVAHTSYRIIITLIFFPRRTSLHPKHVFRNHVYEF